MKKYFENISIAFFLIAYVIWMMTYFVFISLFLIINTLITLFIITDLKKIQFINKD